MDQITHEMRLASWKPIIEKCHARPEGQSVRQWLAENGVKEKQYYYWQRRLRKEAYGKISDTLPATQSTDSGFSFAEIPTRLERIHGTGDTSFKPDAVLRTPRVTIELSNSVSDRLLGLILGGMSNAE